MPTAGIEISLQCHIAHSTISMELKVVPKHQHTINGHADRVAVVRVEVVEAWLSDA